MHTNAACRHPGYHSLRFWELGGDFLLHRLLAAAAREVALGFLQGQMGFGTTRCFYTTAISGCRRR
jgi:hypothetical protein